MLAVAGGCASPPCRVRANCSRSRAPTLQRHPTIALDGMRKKHSAARPGASLPAHTPSLHLSPTMALRGSNRAGKTVAAVGALLVAGGFASIPFLFTQSQVSRPAAEASDSAVGMARSMPPLPLVVSWFAAAFVRWALASFGHASDSLERTPPLL